MLWSRWPWVAIITSASSSTNMVIFLGSMSLYLVHQSWTVPGVPMTICCCNLAPRSTEHNAESHAVNRLVTRNLFFRREYKYYHILTSISPNGICQLHIWTKFPHLLNDLTSLQCELVRRCDAKALKENFFDLVNTFQGLIKGYQLSQEIENAVILWGCSAYLSPLIVRVYMAEHGQRKCSSFTCARLRLCNQILRSESRKK